MRSHRSSTETPSSVESENPYWISFSDIMAGLLAVFILVLISFAIKLDRQTSMNEHLRKKVMRAIEQLATVAETRKAILHEIQSELANKGIIVEISESNDVLHIPDEQLNFKSGRYDLQEKMVHVVDKIGTILENSLSKLERTKHIDTIFVEGHTDSVRNNREGGNWGLSTQRAITIWRYWTESPGTHKGLLKMKNIDGKPIFSVSGYAETRRLVVLDVRPEDRQKNRRIDLRFTMRALETGDFKKLLDQLNDGQ